MKKSTVGVNCNEVVNKKLIETWGPSKGKWVNITIFWSTLIIAWVVILVLLLHFKILKNESTRLRNFFLMILGTFTCLGGGIMAYFYLYLKPQYGQCAVVADPMNRKLFTIGKFPISQWPLAHFIMYIGFGMMCPKYWWILVLAGASWEGTELLMKVMQRKQNAQVARTMIDEEGYTYLTYWESTVEDIIINTTGIIIGVGLAKLISIYHPFGLKIDNGFLSI